MDAFVPYLIPAVVALVFVAVTVWIVYINLRQPKPETATFIESEDVESRPIVVPTEQQLRETFEVNQKGGKEGLLQFFEERKQQSERAPNESEQSEEKQAEAPQAHEIEMLPEETSDQFLKRISKMPRKEGESKFVKMPAGSLGTITVMPLPRFTAEQERRFANEIDNLTNEMQPQDDSDPEEHSKG